MKLRPVSVENPITADDIGKWAVTRGSMVALIEDIDLHNDATVCGTLYTARDRGISAYWFRTGLFSALREPHQNDIVEIIEPDRPEPDKQVGHLADAAQILIDALDRWHVICARHSVGGNTSPAIKAVVDAHQAAKDALAAYQAALNGGEG